MAGTTGTLMPKIRRFKFSGLKRYTAEQVALQESLATYLSYHTLKRDSRRAIESLVERYLKSPCQIGEVDFAPVSNGDLAQLIPRTGCIMVLGAAPGEHKILVELDTMLAAFAIDRLLGGSGDHARIQRPLTEIEAGVLSFIILKLIGHFRANWESGRELALTLDRFAANLEEIREIIDSESSYHLLGVRVAVAKKSGYARVLIPAGLVVKRFSSPPPGAGPTELELSYIRSRLNAIGEVPVEGIIQAATLDLSDEDTKNLEVGDIIILENHDISKTADGLQGNVFLKLGNGENGGLRGRLTNDGDRLRLEISEIVVQEQPPEENSMASEKPHPKAAAAESKAAPGPSPEPEPAAANAPAAAEVEVSPAPPPQPENEDNLSETQGLLRDVAAPVVVELGRIKLNTAQVVRLRAGQVLRLPRGPNDPVDLVVNGKLFARGELIEVDGELGVRLLQIAGAS